MIKIANWIKSKFTLSSGFNRFNYKQYWEERYHRGGNSGLGSYGVLAQYKANFINLFVHDHAIQTVIDFGCGDGNQLSLAKYPSYLGLDVSKHAISMCLNKFHGDQNKSFIYYDPLYFYNQGFFNADLVICLDVLYHITPEMEFHKTLTDIFSCSKRYVILYTSLKTKPSDKHIVHRDMIPILSRIENFAIEQIVDTTYNDLTSAQFVVMQQKISGEKVVDN